MICIRSSGVKVEGVHSKLTKASTAEVPLVLKSPDGESGRCSSQAGGQTRDGTVPADAVDLAGKTAKNPEPSQANCQCGRRG